MNKGMVKNVGVVVAGVLIAGIVLAQFRDIGLIAMSGDGYKL